MANLFGIVYGPILILILLSMAHRACFNIEIELGAAACGAFGEARSRR
jgi:hypothetical protein